MCVYVYVCFFSIVYVYFIKPPEGEAEGGFVFLEQFCSVLAQTVLHMKLPLKRLLLYSTLHTVHVCTSSNNFAYEIATFVYTSSNSFAYEIAT